MFDNLFSIRLYCAKKEKTWTSFFQKKFPSKNLVGQAHLKRQQWIHTVCAFWPGESQTVQLYNQVSHKSYNCAPPPQFAYL